MGRRTRGGTKRAADREACEPFQASAEVVKSLLDDDEIATTAAPSRPLRALIVDDNTDLAYLMSVMVHKCGHEVQIAYDGPTALEMAAAFHPDVLFVDIALPKLDGFCVARELRRRNLAGDSLLIAVTGYADEAHHSLGMQAGFDHYVVKPVAFRTLSELLLLARNRVVRSVEERIERNNSREVIHALASG